MFLSTNVTLKLAVGVDLMVWYYTCPWNSGVSCVVKRKSALEQCFRAFSVVHLILASIPQDLTVNLTIYKKIQDPVDPFDPATLLGAVASNEVDIVPSCTISADRFERFRFQFPYYYNRVGVIVGRGFSESPVESRWLLFRPFSRETWAAVVVMVLCLWALERWNSSGLLGFLAKNVAVFAVLYASNLRAIICIPSSRLRFNNLAEFSDLVAAGQLRILISGTDNFRFKSISESKEPSLEKLQMHLPSAVRIMPQGNAFYRLLNSSKVFVTIDTEVFFSMYHTETGQSASEDGFRFMDFLPLPNRFGGTAVSSQRKDLVEHYSRVWELFRRVDQRFQDTRQQQTPPNTDATLIVQRHFQLSYYIFLFGILTAILSLLVEIYLYLISIR